MKSAQDLRERHLMSIESITVFRPTGPLNKVWLMWEVVKKFYRLSDDAHIREIASLEKQIDAHFGEGDPSQQTMRSAALLADQRHLADLSGNILIRATVLHLQTAFVEFAVKEVFKLVLPNHTIPQRPDFMRDLMAPLKVAGAFTNFPSEYLQDVFGHRDAVRNSFAHGDWFELAKAVQDLDLEKAFVGTGKLMDHFQANLRRLRPKQGKVSVTGDIEAVLRKIEYWHPGSIAAFKIMYRDEHGVWNGVRWDGERASLFALGETDQKMARAKLLRGK
jgi:hypothetical protein